jgi:hypothetical protein
LTHIVRSLAWCPLRFPLTYLFKVHFYIHLRRRAIGLSMATPNGLERFATASARPNRRAHLDLPGLLQTHCDRFCSSELVETSPPFLPRPEEYWCPKHFVSLFLVFSLYCFKETDIIFVFDLDSVQWSADARYNLELVKESSYGTKRLDCYGYRYTNEHLIFAV